MEAQRRLGLLSIACVVLLVLIVAEVALGYGLDSTDLKALKWDDEKVLSYAKKVPAVYDAFLTHQSKSPSEMFEELLANIDNELVLEAKLVLYGVSSSQPRKTFIELLKKLPYEQIEAATERERDDIKKAFKDNKSSGQVLTFVGAAILILCIKTIVYMQTVMEAIGAAFLLVVSVPALGIGLSAITGVKEVAVVVIGILALLLSVALLFKVTSILLRKWK